MSHIGTYLIAGTTVQVGAPAPLDHELRRLLVDLQPARRGRVEQRAEHRIEVVVEADGRYRLSLDGEPSENSVDLGMALAGVLDLCNTAVAQHWSRRRVALHAAVVEMHGSALALVGYSGTGKTTLAAAALQRGWGFVSDELGLIDDDFVAHAYHRPLGLRSGGRARIDMEQSITPLHTVLQPEPASSLGRLVPSAPLVGVVFIDALGEGEPTAPVVKTPGEALADLLNNVLGTEGVEVKVFRRLERLVRQVPCVRLRRGSPAEMLVGLETLLPVVGGRPRR